MIDFLKYFFTLSKTPTIVWLIYSTNRLQVLIHKYVLPCPIYPAPLESSMAARQEEVIESWNKPDFLHLSP